jgi:cellulose synthase/poly-beta-1,6-N-acetylglucosamine synthase-like glycosyltransferase
MGWHGGVLLEQPPLNLKDHFYQRRRWVLGTMQNLEKFPRLHRFKLMYKSITYFLGFASAVASTILMVHNYFSLAVSIPDINSRLSSIISLPERLTTFSWDALVQSINNINPVELGVASLLLFTSIVWIASYQVGLFLNLRYSRTRSRRRILLHIQTLLLCPIIGLVETFPAFWAMIEYSIRKKTLASRKMPAYDFYVVSK